MRCRRPWKEASLGLRVPGRRRRRGRARGYSRRVELPRLERLEILDGLSLLAPQTFCFVSIKLGSQWLPRGRGPGTGRGRCPVAEFVRSRPWGLGLLVLDLLFVFPLYDSANMIFFAHGLIV